MTEENWNQHPQEGSCDMSLNHLKTLVGESSWDGWGKEQRDELGQSSQSLDHDPVLLV